MSASDPSRLPHLELECMKVLWKKPGLTVAQVRAELPRPLAYTTVMTLLDRMRAKGVVERRKNGRAYLYSPLLDPEAARHSAVCRLLDGFFDNDPAALARYLSQWRGGEPAAPLSRSRTRRAAPVPARLSSQIDDSLL